MEGRKGVHALEASTTLMFSFGALPEMAFSKGKPQRTGQLVLCRLSRVHQGGDGTGGLVLRLTSRHMCFKRKEENQGQEDVICLLSWRMGSERSVLLINVNY